MSLGPSIGALLARPAKNRTSATGSGRRAWFVISALAAATVGLPAAPLTPSQEQLRVRSDTDGRQRRVLGLYSARQDQPGYVAFAAAFSAAITQAWGNVDQYAEYLDYGRVSITEEYLAAFAEFLGRKYKGDRRPDVIFAISDAAFQFIDRHGAALFPDVPVIYVGPEEKWLPHDAVVSWEYDWTSSIDLALVLHPLTRRVFVVAGTSEYDRQHLNAVRDELNSRSFSVPVTYLDGLPMDKLEETVANLPPHSVIYFVLLTQDGAGRRLERLSGLDRIAAVANAPIYGWSETMMGHGVVGGAQATYAGMARATAEVAVRHFQGVPADQLSLARADVYATLIDWRQVQRWGIDERLLPADATILFREPGIWDRYRGYIAGVGMLVVLQFVLIGALLVHRARRRGMEVSLRESERRFRIAAEQNQDLAARLINAQEEERTRIARDLHDDVGQRVASLSIGLSGLKRRLGEVGNPMLGDLWRLQVQTSDLSRDLRQLAHELHPGTLEHVGLLKALKVRCAEVNVESGLTARLTVAPGWSDVPNHVALCLYRVAQEALRNIVKHAHAQTAIVALARKDGQIVMRITDDGRGFDADASAGYHGLGLVNMGERVRTLGGTFHVQSFPEGGTVATVTLPAGDAP